MEKKQAALAVGARFPTGTCPVLDTPTIQQDRLVMELHPWYGSAALMKVNEMHKRLKKKEM